MFFVVGGHPQSQLHYSNIFLVIHHGIVHRYYESNPKKSTGNHIVVVVVYSLAASAFTASSLFSIISTPFPVAVKD